MNKRVELILENLACAGCAAKIEERIKKLEGLESVELNFITKTLSFIPKEGFEPRELHNRIDTIVKEIEPDVCLIEKTGEKPRKDDREIIKKTVILSIGTALFIGGLIIQSMDLNAIPLYLLSYVLVGLNVIRNSIRNILRGEVFDEYFLMTVATIGAFIIGEYPEAAAVMIFYRIGDLLQERALNLSKRSIENLMDLTPDYAHLKRDEILETVHPESVGVGEIIIVKPGEKIPLDGVVVQGSSNLDRSALTGESLPVSVSVDDEIQSGSINISGLLEIKVTKPFDESTVSKILHLVENSVAKKAKTERYITRFARYYTPIVVISALLLATIPTFFFGGDPTEWVYRALVFLVISCPCALLLSIPLGFFGGIGAASRHGILLKGSNHLDALNRIGTVVFDKTGTLTEGKFTVDHIIKKGSMDEDEIINLAAKAEIHAYHPLAVAIRAKATNVDNSVENSVENYEEIPGHGVSARIEGKNILLGNRHLMIREAVKCDGCDTKETAVFFAVDGKMEAIITFSDKIKKDAYHTVSTLRNRGIKTAMLTGDNREVADRVAKNLGIDLVFSELLPHEKVEKIEEIKNLDGLTLFMGDGVNDAPVLVSSDMGIAMGGLGSDAAIEAADMVIMNDQPSKLIDAIKIAGFTRNIVRQNIAFSFLFKIVVLIFGALGSVPLWFAVIADVGVALIAVLNSIRITKKAI